MFNDERAAKIEQLLSGRSTEEIANRFVLVIVPGLNVLLLGVRHGGQVTQLIPIVDDYELDFTLGKSISLVDAISAIRRAAQGLDGSPT